MAASYIGGAVTGGLDTDYEVLITHGLTISSGDVLVFVVCVNDNANTIVHKTTQESSYPMNKVFEEDGQDTSASGSHYAIFTRVAGASEPSTYDFTLGTNADYWGIVVQQFRGVDNANLWDVAPSAAQRNYSTGNNVTTVTVPSMVTTYAGSVGLILAHSDGYNSGDYYSAPQGSYGNLVVKGASTWMLCGMANQILGAAGTYGALNPAMTISIANDFNAIQCALRASGIQPTLTTWPITSITSSTAKSGGTVTVPGDQTITARGVCWNTSGTPTIADDHTHD